MPYGATRICARKCPATVTSGSSGGGAAAGPASAKEGVRDLLGGVAGFCPRSPPAAGFYPSHPGWRRHC
eukprot:5371387-Alexandrium_andersonii.AAC.1